MYYIILYVYDKSRPNGTRDARQGHYPCLMQMITVFRACRRSPGLRRSPGEGAAGGTQSTDNSGPLALHQAGIYILYICVLIVLLNVRPNGKWKTRRRPQSLKASRPCWRRAPAPPNYHYHTAPARPCPPKEP